MHCVDSFFWNRFTAYNAKGLVAIEATEALTVIMVNEPPYGIVTNIPILAELSPAGTIVGKSDIVWGNEIIKFID